MPTQTKRPARAPAFPKQNQLVTAISPVNGHQPQRLLFPVKDVEFDGVAMGVLSDGTPYLHLRGLARLCGVDHGVLSRMANNWSEEQTKPRGQKVAELLKQQGFKGDALHLMIAGPSGETPAYTDAVCMALLEYYAFDATQGSADVAQRNYRILARTSFRKFIYNGCRYDPDAHIPESWRTLHERILLNDQVPVGYFSIFREIADLVVHMIKGGCTLDSHTLPDASVGAIWASYWAQGGLEQTYGARIKSPHNFPEWFPQSVANPVPAWIYPVQALGDFRLWLYQIYVPTNFPKYVANKVAQGVFLPARADALLISVRRPIPPQLLAQ